jgi:hypothetical protein
VFDSVLRHPPKQDDGTELRDGDHLTEVRRALDMPIDLLRDRDSGPEPLDGDLSSADLSHAVLSLLELRLLRAFCQLHDHRTKRLLIHLAEHIVKRQTGPDGDAA